jgi:hypothetical protein
MNKKEQLLAQLRELESEEPEQNETEEAEESQPSGGLWDFKLPADWKPPVRYVTEEYAQVHSRNFKPGDIWIDVRPSGYVAGKHIQAVPRPRYSGQVGHVITKEMEEAYDAEWQLWLTSSLKLEGCVWTWRRIIEFQDYWTNRPNKEEMQKSFNEEWNFLLGVWQSRGMNAPSMDDLERWSREWKN